MPVIKIGDRLVGDGQPTYVIAEIGVNHNGILPLALELIDASIDAGADAVKFQKRSLDKLYARKYLDNANSGEKTLRYLLPIVYLTLISPNVGTSIPARVGGLPMLFGWRRSNVKSQYTSPQTQSIFPGESGFNRSRNLA